MLSLPLPEKLLECYSYPFLELWMWLIEIVFIADLAPFPPVLLIVIAISVVTKPPAGLGGPPAPLGPPESDFLGAC